MIDVHTHILPSLDDGAATLEQSLEMAHAAVAEGITTVVATPHVRDDYPTTAAEMEEAVAELRVAVAADGLALEILTGGEIALDRLETLDDGALHRFALGSGSYVLLECPYFGWPLNLDDHATGCRAPCRVRPVTWVSAIRIATIAPERPVSTATVQIAARGLAMSAMAPVMTAPAAKPPSRQRR